MLMKALMRKLIKTSAEIKTSTEMKTSTEIKM